MPAVTFQVLEGIDKGRTFRELPTPVTIGREEGNVLRLNDERISRFHAKIQAGGSDVVDMAIAGIVQSDVPDTGQKVMAETAAWMHGHGLSDGVIRQTLTNHEVTPEEFRAVQLWKSQKMASKEFVSRYLAGEPEEIKSMLLADVVLSSKIKTGASS